MVNILKNQRGQVAIFIALIFQVLFIFFAMIINVGLLVHHKINLQNSVDLAAYYGAMKQAESLNAIAHINYQIRQSWKLLTWRYRQVGTAGNFSAAHPFDKTTKSIRASQTGETNDNNPAYKKFFDMSPFCVTYTPFEPMPPGENTCKRAEDIDVIPLFQPPQVIAPFLGLSVAMRNTANRLLQQATNRCKAFGAWNYITLSRFVTSFVMDQAEKKLLMRHIALGVSEKEDDIRDLDGDSVKVGIDRTLRNNLTAANRDRLSFKVYNPLGTAECGGRDAQHDPPRWLSEVKIFPTFFYTDTSCNTSQVRSDPQSLAFTPKHGMDPEIDPDQRALIQYYQAFVSGAQAPPFNFSMGYEKNPWCMAYVGVSAKTQPRIPFSPIDDVVLEARAYAKPFGGKIGPWFGNRWPRGPAGGNAQSEGERTDDLLPIRARDFASLGPNDINNFKRVANYSKYPGDIYGMKSYLTLGQFGKAIFAMDPKWRTATYAFTGNAGLQGSINPNDPSMNPDNAHAPNFNHWAHLGMPFEIEGHGDILAYDDLTKSRNPMRELELVGIAPDIFDITYYSIEPDYYNMYFKRIRDGYLPKKTGYNFIPRSDLGSRVGDAELQDFSVKKQMAVVQKMTQGTFAVDVATALTYLVTKVEQLLTAWSGKSLLDYSIDPQSFGKCAQTPLEKFPTSGDCLGPGRTGYSVKLISEDYLKSTLPLGGPGVPPDRILNPPPANF